MSEDGPLIAIKCKNVDYEAGGVYVSHDTVNKYLYLSSLYISAVQSFVLWILWPLDVQVAAAV